MKKENAFTLIELLAVIVILAIIAVIATPLAINVINNAKKNSFKNTAYGLIDAVKLQYSENYLNGNTNELFFTFPDATGLKFSGETPKGGSIRLTEEGKISLAIHNNEWCAMKGTMNGEVLLEEYEDGKCILPEEADIPVITLLGKESMYLSLGSAYTEPGYSIKTIGGEELANEQAIVTVKGQLTGTSEIDTSIEETYTITYKVTYKGNVTTKTRTIHVGNYKPTIKIEPNKTEGYSQAIDVTISVSAFEEYSINGFNYIITKDGVEINNTKTEENSKTVSLRTDGTYEIKVTAIDSEGNVSEIISEPYYIDVTPPTITFTEGDTGITMEANQVPGYNFKQGVTVEDNNEISLSDVKVSSDIATDEREYEVTYTATDKAGNITTKIRKITVLPAESPIVNLSTFDTNNKWTKAQSILLTANDPNGMGSLTYQITKDGVSLETVNVEVDGSNHAEATIDLDTSGTYTIKAIGIDKAGNETEINGGIYYIDVDKPTIDLAVSGSPFNANGWSKTDIVLNVTTSDTGGSLINTYKYCYGNNCTPNTIGSGNTITISTESEANYVCAISIDGAENTSEKKCVGPYKLDKTSPTLTVPADEAILLSEVSSYDLMNGVSAEDTLSQLNGNVSKDKNLSASVGEYIITYSVSDKAGNTNSKTRKIVVLEQTSWSFTSDGTFTVPATGTYTIEMHGGGGGGGGGAWAYSKSNRNTYSATGGGGGGSGEIYTTTLVAGQTYNITIGAGGSGGSDYYEYSIGFASAGRGSTGRQGGTTSFGTLYSVAGGLGGTGGYVDPSYNDCNGKRTGGSGGSAVGSLASKGNNGASGTSTVAGGSGGSSTGNYGNGGTASESDGGAGKPGAIFITWNGL